MALTPTSVMISGLNVITASILITFIVSKKTYQLESICVLSWVVINKLDLLLIFTIFSFGLKFIWLLLVMLKGVEGKKGKGKAPCGRGCGSTRDEDDGGSCCDACSYWHIPSPLGLDMLPFMNVRIVDVSPCSV